MIPLCALNALTGAVGATQGDAMETPLSDLRVLDFGQAAVGPIAAEYLGWLGADVIKVESPNGDTVRGTKPSLGGTGHTFLGNNLNKRGIVLDLKDFWDYVLKII